MQCLNLIEHGLKLYSREQGKNIVFSILPENKSWIEINYVEYSFVDS